MEGADREHGSGRHHQRPIRTNGYRLARYFDLPLSPFGFGGGGGGGETTLPEVTLPGGITTRPRFLDDPEPLLLESLDTVFPLFEV
jgi:hypothetical protein